MKNRAPPLRGVVHPHHTGLAPLPTYLHRRVCGQKGEKTDRDQHIGEILLEEETLVDIYKI